MLYDSAMKYTVKNNSSAPHDLVTIKGRVSVIAGESVEVDLDDATAAVYAHVPFFEMISDGIEAKKIDPLDHDGDGRKGGSLPNKRGRPPKADK